ncbi:arabinan endo-1,5-alpha-L-arabinosidase [Actomonas aquatica]|uniref:Arabinan endo-1,5-alpha-L-arabinosidase n=1 Tax=Actomonas aquatica TaxID=2866162 RepID=A0ABZ1C680_9BACT|nr:arabinan endo-1,5-alpha-L-arabinosidase [Opitutus sp. WL0086]WRQ86034.1 arabinan endo-1,5-alpha-L-arabinosidase [Opitutus sp. WL0086]
MTHGRFLRRGLPLLASLLAAFGAARAEADSTPTEATLPQLFIHDPVIARDGGTYYLYSTGPGITFYSSPDRINWTCEGRVFPGEPAWAADAAPRFNGHLWAPDIVEHDGRFYLYYSVSAFAANTSAIGVTVNTTLDPDSPDYEWRDQGIVVQSVPNRDLWNAIDSAVVWDDDGTPWLSFGSFWGGLKLVQLNPDLVSLAEPQEWHTIAKRERAPFTPDAEPGHAALEAPFLFHHDGYYYLFLSWDFCCRGSNSTYKMMVGRATDVRGPYLDREGVDLAAGGGSLIMDGTAAFPGVGHNAVYTWDGEDYMVFHAYEAANNGRQTLKIAPITWDDEGWPVVDPTVLDTFRSRLLNPAEARAIITP